MDEMRSDRMVIPWRIFGSSQRAGSTDQPVIGRFTRSMGDSALPKSGLTTLFRRDDHSRLAIHRPKRLMKGGCPAVEEARQARIDTGGQVMDPASLKRNGGVDPIRRDMAEVAHFMIRRLDEYLLKIFRGDGLMTSNRHGIGCWRGPGRNDAADLVAADHVEGFGAEYGRLTANPEPAALHRRTVEHRLAKPRRLLSSDEVRDLRSILKRSTDGTVTVDDLAQSRRLVTQISPSVAPRNALDGDMPRPGAGRHDDRGRGGCRYDRGAIGRSPR
ncbi:hypothetical protein [Paracoccus spongiarum]|uniref:DUF222 domain-containing protein n=1 Tax=Paracoccus spongiarum TaxID=3064387 RepID=A0ABT9JF77_9RHOB|nr:hypothetical protein [Paracoccus sp. 2205BS29-5]MDP5307742.1 hypothetical protein [Paracoccus sp. 2205BS29-5]